MLNNWFAAQLIHHGLGHNITGTTPDIHHLVVALALCYQAGGVLRVYFMHFFFSCGNQLIFLFGYEHVVHANRDAGACRKCKSGAHQLVSHDYRVAQTATTEAGVNQAGDLLLLQRLVHHTEWQTDWQNFRKNSAAYGGLVTRALFVTHTLCVQSHFIDTHHDLSLQINLLGLIGTQRF